MKLTFVQRHLSITAFPEIELPQLTIVLGLNGSGKSHLLQAIANGSVSNDVAPLPPGNVGQPPGVPGTGPIKLMTPDQLGVVQGQYTSQASQMAQPSLIIPFELERRRILAPFLAQLEELRPGLTTDLVRSTEDAWRLGSLELIQRGEVHGEAARVEAIFEAAEAALRHPPPGSIMSRSRMARANPDLPHVGRVADKLRTSALTISEDQMRQFMPWTADQFQADLAEVFGKYRDAFVRNRLARLGDQATGSQNSMSDADFVSYFGSPPWDQVSENFKAFNLPYLATSPDLFPYDPFSFSIFKIGSGEEVAIGNLSSGERVLFQFALSVFRYDEELTTVSRPKLLLLDEMDAPLHPEMVHRWLGAVNEGLVAQQGVSCILTTHSPTTIALAPEVALYEMTDGQSGLSRISKQDALNKLTFGVPTLSIDYSGRRQVFAESDTDAAVFERVYSVIKSSINCERELNFLSTGMRDKDAREINSGCIIVTSIVEQMTSYGNRNVFGIVDWDGKTTSTDRIKVLAEGVRDGIENVLLDPLLICLMLIKVRRAPEGLDDIDRFAGAATLDAAALQRLVDAVQNKAFPNSTTDKQKVHYVGGATVNVLKQYLTIDDHDLEDALVKAFPTLKKWTTGGRGKLVMGVIEEVLTEYRGFCPIELQTVFETIANAPG